MDLLTRLVFMLLAAIAGFLPGGLVVRALLGERPRTGFDGVAEVFFGSMGGILLGLIVGFVVSGRLERAGKLWGILLLIALIGVEVILANFLSR